MGWYLLAENNTVKLGLEPVDGLLLVDLVVDANLANSTATLSNALSRASQDNEKVHTVDTDAGIVLDAQVNVLLDTETKVSGGAEVGSLQFVFLDLQAALEDFKGLGTTDGAVDGNLFIAADGEGADSVASLAVDGGLASQLLEHLGGTSQTITTLTNTNVDTELLDLDVAHGVAVLGLLGFLYEIVVSILKPGPLAPHTHPLCEQKRWMDGKCLVMLTIVTSSRTNL